MKGSTYRSLCLAILSGIAITFSFPGEAEALSTAPIEDPCACEAELSKGVFAGTCSCFVVGINVVLAAAECTPQPECADTEDQCTVDIGIVKMQCGLNIATIDTDVSLSARCEGRIRKLYICPDDGKSLLGFNLACAECADIPPEE